MNNKKIQRKKLVSIVVVTWNNEKDIEDCLSSCLKQDYDGIKEIVVVDNNSKDNTTELIKGVQILNTQTHGMQDVSKIDSFEKTSVDDKEMINIELLEKETNLYFAGGSNLGIQIALENNPELDFIAVMNADTIASKDWIRKSIELASKDEKIGVVSPKIKFFDSKLINSAGLVYDGFMQAYDRGFNEKDSGQYDDLEELPAVSGTAMLLNTRMIKDCGMFWEKLEMYLEDLEYCIRMSKKGWKVLYAGNTHIFHKYMTSTKQNSDLDINERKMKHWVLIALRHYTPKSKLAMLFKYVQYKFKVLTSRFKNK